MKSKNELLFARRIIRPATALFGACAFANALYGAYRAFQICPSGVWQQVALLVLFASGLGMIFSLMLALVFIVWTVLGFARHGKAGGSNREPHKVH